MTLAPGHVDELRRSGLTDETIARAGLYAATEPGVRDLLGFGAGSGLVFPYPELNGSGAYARVKLDAIPADGKRYRSPKGKPNRLYIPPLLDRAILADAGTPLWITEGEKKSLKAVQEGLACVAVPGVWSWKTRDSRDQSAPIADLEHIVWPGRTVYLVFDSDLADKIGVRWAEFALARELERRGATVQAVRLPGGPAGEKVGLDDYLLTHSVETLCALEPVAVSDPATLPPTIIHEGDDYRVTWLDGIALCATALRESSGEVHAELTVTHGEAVLSWGRLNLASTTAREGLVKKLDAAAPRVARWRERLEVACRQIAARARDGAPLEALVPAPRPAVADLIEDVLPLGETSIVYADGDSGKGWLALAMAVAHLTGQTLPHLRPLRRGGRVAYLDWETTASEVGARIYALCRGLGVTLPPGALLYRPMTRALADDAARLRVEFDRHGVDFVIVDSFVPACGADPEGADATIRLMNSLRTFARATRLVLAHVNRLDADKARGTTRPWGSVFVRNLARATWEIKRPAPDGDDLVLGCYLTKRNDAPRGAPPWGLRFQFDTAGAVTVTDEPLTRAPGLLAKATTWQQVHAALSHGPQTAEAVALTLDLNVKTVRRTLERHRDLGHVVTPRGHDPLLWSLVSTREVA